MYYRSFPLYSPPRLRKTQARDLILFSLFILFLSSCFTLSFMPLLLLLLLLLPVNLPWQNDEQQAAAASKQASKQSSSPALQYYGKLHSCWCDPLSRSVIVAVSRYMLLLY